MSVRQYIGARYVTKVYENSLDPSSAEWEANVNYEPLTLVTYNDGSYLSKKEVPANIGNPAANPVYWAQTGFYNGQISYLQSEIDTINGVISNYDADIEQLKRRTRSLKGNLIFNDIHNVGLLNGSCYVGNHQIVSYYRKVSNNTGILKCFDFTNYSTVWEYPIKGYHGNTVTYNPNTNMLYICGCIDEDNSNLINVIVEIDLANPSVVNREITLTGINTCVSLTYDKTTDKFYALEDGGNTPNVSDILYTYSNDLSTLEDSTRLADFPTIKYSIASVQGAVLSANGIVYVLSYNYSSAYIAGYDPESGELLNVASIPAMINRCRDVGESESIIYDYDNDDYLIASDLYVTGIEDWFCANYFEIDLYKGIVELSPNLDDFNFGVHDNKQFYFMELVIAGDTLKPSWLIYGELITIPNDGINFSRITHTPIRIHAYHTIYGVSERDDTLYGLDLVNFNGCILGYTAIDKTKVRKCTIVNSNCWFGNCDFISYFEPEGGVNSNIVVRDMTRVLFNGCVFDDFTGAGSPYHIYASVFCDVQCLSCTFDGAMTHYVAVNGSTVTEI